MTEYYREASLSKTVQHWHAKFAADKAEQRAWLADVCLQAQCMHCANPILPCWRNMGNRGTCQQLFRNQAVM